MLYGGSNILFLCNRNIWYLPFYVLDTETKHNYNQLLLYV